MGTCDQATWFIHCVLLDVLQEEVHVETRQIDILVLRVCHSSSLPGAAAGGGERRRPLFRARSRSAGSAGASAAQRKPLFSVALFVRVEKGGRGGEGWYAVSRNDPQLTFRQPTCPSFDAPEAGRE